MRYIERLPKPDILVRKEKEWLKNFLASGKKRPDASKYRHKKILSALNAMSFHKCFYCEKELKGVSSEIDHFIEVAEDKKLAFEWTNLYLACDNCNNKSPNKTIPTTDVLDPCKDSDPQITEHITFEDEIICAVNNSVKGLKTIQKYKLDTEQLDYLRGKRLQVFYKIINGMRKKAMEDGQKVLNQKDLEKLKAFANKDKPFSLMFENLLQDMGLL